MTIVEPNERWGTLSRAACAALAAQFREVEHVGSTSVPGLAAKPVIDLMGSIDGLDDVNEGALKAMGFRLIPDVMPDRLFCGSRRNGLQPACRHQPELADAQ